MSLRTTLAALGAAFLCAAPAVAQDEPAATTPRLMPDSLNLELIEGWSVPEDCMYLNTVERAPRCAESGQQ